MVHIPHEKRGKMDAKACQCIFVGYCSDRKGYRVWDPSAKKVMVSRDVIFYEDCDIPVTPKEKPEHDSRLPFIDSSEESDEEHNEENATTFDSDMDIEQEDISTSTLKSPQTREESQASTSNESVRQKETAPCQEGHPSDETPTPERRRTARAAKPTSKYQEYLQSRKRNARTALLADIVEVPEKKSKSQLSEPKDYTQAVNSPDSHLWSEAMNSEMDSVNRNCTWRLCTLPSGANLITTKWVYKVKVEQSGEIRRKARLVARGFNQELGVDVMETYSPVVKYTTLRLLFAHAVKDDLEIRHLDVETAFLQGDLEEDVYIQQPEGYVDPHHPNYVCKLQKAIYGLKQSGRVWNIKLDGILKGLGLHRCKYDPCVYTFSRNNEDLKLAVFVDDLLAFSNSKRLIQEITKKLQEYITLRDLGDIRRCFNVNITRDRERGLLFMNQTDSIIRILKEYGMEECNPCSTPMSVGSSLTPDASPKSKAELERLSKLPYQNVIGSLMYLLQMTRPDLAYVVSTMSRHNTCYGLEHWNVLKRTLRYLQGTKDCGLCFSRDGNQQLKGYCDGTWGCDLSDGRSVTGFVFILQGAAISWHSRKQPTVATSSTVAEYQALSSATMEALWLRGLAMELSIQGNQPIELMCDNKGAVDLGRNANFSKTTKHVCVKHHFIKESVDGTQIKINRI